MMSQEADAYNAMLDLVRRLPPTRVEENVATLSSLQPDLADDLLMATDQPLKVMTDGEGASKGFLCCEYNRDGDSYRSPWSNMYTPPLDDGTLPSDKLRELEVAMNNAFDSYREMYFEGGVSSVYLWDLEDVGFAGVVLMKKELPSDAAHHGSWDSIHVFEARERGRAARYSLTSTVMLWVNTKDASSGKVLAPAAGEDGVSLSGTMTRQVEQELPLASQTAHIHNIGRMVEDMEIKMRNSLSEVYFGKTKDVIGELRTIEGSERQRQEAMLRNELLGAFGRRK